MSKYTSSDDNNNQNYEDIAGSYDSHRLYDRGKFGSSRSPDVVSPFSISSVKHGLYTSHDSNPRIYMDTRNEDFRTSERLPRSLSDRNAAAHHGHIELPMPLPDQGLQKVASVGDSTSCQSSEITRGAEDRPLSHTPKNKYQESANKKFDDPSTRLPFSSWRQSGNFEEVIPTTHFSSREESKDRRPESEKDKHLSETESWKLDSGNEASSTNEHKALSGNTENTGKSADELIYNFRKALHRHAISESEKAATHHRVVDTNVSVKRESDDSTAQKLERLRAVRAKIHDKRKSENVQSGSFATEFKMDVGKQEKSRSGSTSSVSSQKSDEKSSQRESLNKGDELKQSSKLARQKLVSDDLKAKYMINRNDKEDINETSMDDTLSRKRSSRKVKHQEHMNYWSKEKDSANEVLQPAEIGQNTSVEEMPGSKLEGKSSLLAKKFENVSHSSPFGSVYSISSKPSSHFGAASSAFISPPTPIAAAASSPDPANLKKLKEKLEEKDKVGHSHNNNFEEIEKQVVISLSDVEKAEHNMHDKKHKKYAKARSLELGLLKTFDKPVSVSESKDDRELNKQEAFDDVSKQCRQERIARYKEERRKQLATISNKFAGGESELPSLFISSKIGEDDALISRSKSLKGESNNKPESDISKSNILRSNSLKEDADLLNSARPIPPLTEISKMSGGLRLAELGSQSKPLNTSIERDVYDESKQNCNTDIIIDKQALKRQKEAHSRKSCKSNEREISRHSKEISDLNVVKDVDKDRPSSYSSRTLLADRVISERKKDTSVTFAKDRVPSSSGESVNSNDASVVQKVDPKLSSNFNLNKKTEASKREPFYRTDGHDSKDKEFEQKRFLEFGTVYTKKDKVEKDGDRKDDKGNEDPSLRTRRQLPSLDNVLSSNCNILDKVEIQEKQRRNDAEREEIISKSNVEEIVKSEHESDLTKVDVSKMSAKEINKRRIADNIERAKSKFQEEKVGHIDPIRFELGTVYSNRKEEMTEAISISKYGTTVDDFKNKDVHIPKIGEQDKRCEKHKDMTGSEVVQTQITPNYSQLKFEMKTKHDIHILSKGAGKDNEKDITGEKALCKPASPKSVRRKAVEQKFGNISDKSCTESFEFGTSYIKKEIGKDKESLKQNSPIHETIESEACELKIPETGSDMKCDVVEHELKEETKSSLSATSPKLSITLLSQKSKENDVDMTKRVSAKQPSPVLAIQDSHSKFDVKSKSVSMSTKHNAEVPHLPMQVPFESQKFVVEAPLAFKDAKPPPEIKSLKIENIKSNIISQKEPVSHLYNMSTTFLNNKKTESIGAVISSSPSQIPEKKSSFTSIEIKSPTVSNTSYKDKTDDLKSPLLSTTKLEPNIKLKSDTVSSQKEISVFNFEQNTSTHKQDSNEGKQLGFIAEGPKQLSACAIPEAISENETVNNSVVQVKHVDDRNDDKLLTKKKLDEKPVPISENEKSVTEKIKEIRKVIQGKKNYLAVSKALEDNNGTKPLEKISHVEQPKTGKAQIEKSPVDKSDDVKIKTSAIIDTCLDDILDKNVEYLSDIEIPDFSRGRSDKKKQRPLSVHEAHKPKRILRKKLIDGRSKSEDRSHFKVVESDNSSKVTDESAAVSINNSVQKSTVHVRDVSTNSQQAATTQIISQTGLPTEALVSNDKLQPYKMASEDKKPGVHSQSQHGEDSERDVVKETVSQYEVAGGMTSDSSDISDRHRLVSKQGTDSDQSTSSSTMSGRKKRKDKSFMRKSKLNESSDDVSSGSRRRDSSDDSICRAARGGGVQRVSSARLSRESKENKHKGDQEVSTVISKFTEAKEKGAKESSHVVKKPEDQSAGRSIRRGNNFSQLLQKFSGSDASSSEKSDSGAPCARSKVLLKRQEACSNSSGSSDENRRTPERTQSLKQLKQEQSEMQQLLSNSVARSSSFKSEVIKSDFMKTRSSPEPESKRQLPDTPSLEQFVKHSSELDNNSKVPTDKKSYQKKGMDSSFEYSSVSESDKSQNSRKEINGAINTEQQKLSQLSLTKFGTQRTEEPRSHSSSEDKSQPETMVVHQPALQSVMTDLVAASQEDNHSKTGKNSSNLKMCVNITSPAKVKEFKMLVGNEMQSLDDLDKQTLQEDAKTANVSAQESIVKSKAEQTVQSQPQNVSSSPSSSQGSIDITSKSEIIKKITTRDRTPEKQSPKRSGPMKVMSPLTGATLTRTESVGRTDSERPKGILKRTPSLKQAGIIVDPELAEVMKTRRQQQDDVEEEIEEQKLTAEEEIRRAREEAQNEDCAEQEREVSVAERVFQMHTKIEEVKSCPVTPRRGSGLTTPKSVFHRSGDISPRENLSFDKVDPVTSLSSSQLIERLTNLEGCQSNVIEKRKKFQLRKRDEPRTRTQPVTWQEIQIADSLETVRKFRSEVIQKSSTNIFEAIQSQEKSLPLTKTEFPQPFTRNRHPRGQRHKTLPLTAAELKAIPEFQIADDMNSLKKKLNFGAQDSKTDSGIVSSFDGDNHVSDSQKNMSVKEDTGEDDPVKLSVSAKASMFLQLQESQKERVDKKSASGAKRYIDRKKRERSRTLPITEDEVKLAVEIADKEEEVNVEAANKTTVMSESLESGDSVVDDLSRISLADKVKLFTTIEEEKKLAAQKKGVPPPPKRKNRKLTSRFATQPVTYEEVEKAAKISPLACSLVKPPDPDILSGLSVKDQRELMAKHAQLCLSQPSLHVPSRAPSRAISVGDRSGSTTETDPVTATHTDLNKNSAPDTSESKENLKPSTIRSRGFEPVKNEEYHSSQITEKVSSITTLDSAKKSNVKSQLEEKLSLLNKGLAPNRDAVPTVSDIKKLLKKDTSTDGTQSLEVREPLMDTNCNRNTMDINNEQGMMSANESTDGEKGDDSGENEIESSGDNLDSDEGLLDSPRVDHEQDTPKIRKEKKSRRRFNRERQSEIERYKTQPAEVPTEDAEEVRLKKRYSGRHITQPVTLDEKKVAEIATEMPEMIKTGSINDRLNALKKSGEEEWKKRLSRNIDVEKIERRSISPPDTSLSVRLQEKTGLEIARPSSIADRLTLLDSAQEGWRDRVGETDVKTFTIEHKITSSGQNVGESPLVARLKGKTPRKEYKESSENLDLISPTSPPKPQPREIICTDLLPEFLAEQNKFTLAPILSADEDNQKACVEVPNIGADIDTFFQRTNDLSVTTPTVNVSVDDFDELFLNANDMLETAKKIRPKRRHNPSSRNPLKTISASLDVRTEYTEVITGVAERELKSAKVAAISQNSGFAMEALAGLASKENFAKVELRKIDSNGAGTPTSNVRLEPYLPLMLIHIKGRRRVQCRLVEPRAGSINSGDCYILITPDRIMLWVGEYSNVIEKAKAADVCDFIKQKRDLGCKNAREVVIVEEKKGILGNGKIFWDLLGGHDSYMSCGPPEEDELYEIHIVDSNMIYKLEENKLVPMQDYWGNQPKYEMFSSDQVFVFDFGSELYLWQGKSVSQNQRKVSLKLAQQLWNQGYDYSDCDINPLSPLRDEEHGGLPRVCDKRPHWTLFGKVNENMETILFREKFADWPDTSRLIKVKSQEEINAPKFDLADLKAFDAKLMIPINTDTVTLLLEGSNVGRGIKWEQDMGGFMQEQIIQTLKVRAWHVLEYDHYEIESHSYGQFHEGDTYVIRWQYMIVNAGMKSLKGQASRFSQLGRERCAYFFWQGKSSTINEKGASALMTVELDEERGPQVRVSQGKEPSCFLNLFGGRMIIHIGKREDESTNTQGPWRFYCLRNEYENEMCLIEVPKDICNLRSVSSCLMLNIVTGKLTVWHGCKSPKHTKKLVYKAAENLQTRCPLEVGLHKGVSIVITEIEEGKEKTDFWRMMNVNIGDRSRYHCLLDNPQSFSHTLRVFHMTSVSGVFEAHEILNPSRTPDLPTKFPVLQMELYMAQQPALFLIDNGHEVFLWQGWWPEGSEYQENVMTGSAQTRFSVDRKCAMETTLEYCKEINSASPPPAYIVYAGLEPLSFTNLFPFWSVDESVREINLKDGKKEAEVVLVLDLLKKLSKTRYSLAELLEPQLPEGVDPSKLESYLSEEEFEAVLEMNREAFYALPSWKQFKLKQQAGLY